MTFIIRDRETGEIEPISQSITTHEEAVLVLEMLNTGMIEGGYEPCFELETHDNVVYLSNYRYS